MVIAGAVGRPSPDAEKCLPLMYTMNTKHLVVYTSVTLASIGILADREGLPCHWLSGGAGSGLSGLLHTSGFTFDVKNALDEGSCVQWPITQQNIMGSFQLTPVEATCVHTGQNCGCM